MVNRVFALPVFYRYSCDTFILFRNIGSKSTPEMLDITKRNEPSCCECSIYLPILYLCKKQLHLLPENSKNKILCIRDTIFLYKLHNNIGSRYRYIYIYGCLLSYRHFWWLAVNHGRVSKVTWCHKIWRCIQSEHGEISSEAEFILAPAH